MRVHYVNGPEVLKCQDKDKCKIVADRETLGYKECPEDADIEFQLTYSCDGGGNDQLYRNQYVTRTKLHQLHKKTKTKVMWLVSAAAYLSPFLKIDS